MFYIFTLLVFIFCIFKQQIKNNKPTSELPSFLVKPSNLFNFIIKINIL